MQEMGDPVGGVLDLRKGPGGIAENGVHVVGVGPGRVVQYGEKRFIEPGD
jgi:C-terminal processing protease CtpA/Prc